MSGHGPIITASASNTQRKFSTHGRAFLTIPDLRSTVSNWATLQGTDLIVDETYHLIPSRQAPDIYTGIQFRPFRPAFGWAVVVGPGFVDRNLDHYLYPGNWGEGTLPNDLVISGLWGGP